MHVLVWLLFLLLPLTACRQDLAERCASDAECSAGESCVSGQCVEGEAPDAGDASTDGECASTDDCPDGFACDPETFSCVDTACFEQADVCVQRTCGEDACTLIPCDAGCAPHERQQGCGCVDTECSVDEDCGEFLCLSGTCQPCKEDAQCGDGFFCTDDGQCREGQSCGDDLDCSARESCRDGVCQEREECVLDRDCDDEEICLNGRCTFSPQCEMDADCPEGFECVGGNCFETLCRGPEDCEAGQLCDAGECVDPPPATQCFVATPSQTIVESQRITLEAFAVDAQGRGVAANFVWSSSDVDVARVEGAVAVGGMAAGSTQLVATLADGDPVQCDGVLALTNPGALAEGDLRIIVTHGATGAPVVGAEVEVDGQSVTTDAAGVAYLSAPQQAFEVSVFHDDFNYLTVQGVQAHDLRLPLYPRTGAGPVAGFTGEFDTSLIHSGGDITLGLAGASLAGGLLDLDLAALLGEPFVTNLNIPGVVDEEIPMPGGLVAYGGAFGFDLELKKTYYAQAGAGPRVAWGLAGKVPFADLLDLFGGGGGADVLSMLLPLFNRFDHGAQPVVLDALPRVVDTADIDRDGDTSERVPDYASFPELPLTPSVRQNLVTDVAISNFPSFSNGSPEVGILVGGTSLPSPGYVPLGISATNDEDGDGRPDTRRLSIAPAHGSLIGGRYAVAAIALNFDAGFGSFAMPAEFSVALWNGQSFPTSISLGTFPDSSAATVDEPSRTVTIAADAGPLYRLRLVGAERTWEIWSVGPAGSMGRYAHTMTVPAAPATREDLFAGSAISLDAIQTNVTMDTLVGATGVGLKNAGLVSTAFNRTPVDR